MAKRHVIEYYEKLANQYQELMEGIKELEASLSENMSSYDVLENMKKTLEPVKESYMTWSWVMYLLNMPNNPKKKARYESQGMRALKKVNPELSNSPDSAIQKNTIHLEKLKHIM